MKFENLYILCKNICERKKAIEIAESNGYTFRNNGIDDCELTLCLYPDGEYQVSRSYFSKRITYQQFMEKYAMSDLKSKVEEAKKTLGLNNHELSLKLGHQKRYITNALLDPSVKRQKNILLKIDALLLKESNDLTHDSEGKALNKKINDAMMISKSELDSLKKEIDHKTQVAEKHADMRAKAEEKMLLAEQDSEKWQCDFWTVSRENIDLTNSNRAISIWLAVSILIIVAILAFGILHFNGVV